MKLVFHISRIDFLSPTKESAEKDPIENIKKKKTSFEFFIF